jgi:hypothetical protein
MEHTNTTTLISIDTYTIAVDNLKQLLRQKKIKYKSHCVGVAYGTVATVPNRSLWNEKSHFKLINNEGPIEDKEIQILSDIVISERKLLLSNFESELDNLSLLNNRLIQFTREPQPSITKARKELSKIYINIYDLIACRVDKETNYPSLRKDLNKNLDRIFPLKLAKKYVNIACFLKKL